MKDLTPATAFHHVVDIQSDGGLPRSLRVVASEIERERIATWLGIPSVDLLDADVTLEPWRKKGVRVRGTLEAKVTQNCVVTLEPVDNTVGTSFEWHFQPELPPATIKRDLELQVEEIDVEPLESGKIDIGAILAEELSLALDPNPRKPDALLEADQGAMAQETKENPFAVLEALKGKDSSKGAG